MFLQWININYFSGLTRHSQGSYLLTFLGGPSLQREWKTENHRDQVPHFGLLWKQQFYLDTFMSQHSLGYEAQPEGLGMQQDYSRRWNPATGQEESSQTLIPQQYPWLQSLPLNVTAITAAVCSASWGWCRALPPQHGHLQTGMTKHVKCNRLSTF